MALFCLYILRRYRALRIIRENIKLSKLVGIGILWPGSPAMLRESLQGNTYLGESVDAETCPYV